jgi:hypothetical protein
MIFASTGHYLLDPLCHSSGCACLWGHLSCDPSYAAGDFIRFTAGDEREEKIIGEVVSATDTTIEFSRYIRMTKLLMNKFSLQPITMSLFPVASQSSVVELVATFESEIWPRVELDDVVSVIPLPELEAGLVHLT